MHSVLCIVNNVSLRHMTVDDQNVLKVSKTSFQVFFQLEDTYGFEGCRLTFPFRRVSPADPHYVCRYDVKEKKHSFSQAWQSSCIVL